MNRSRHILWLTLCLVCLLITVFVWPRHKPERDPLAVPAPAPQAASAAQTVRSAIGQTTQTSGSTAPFALLTLNPDTNATVAGAALKRQSRLKYRLSNTSESYSNFIHNPKAVILENALIDSGLPLNLAIPDSLKSPGDAGAYIVQARGVIDGQFRGQLLAAGALIVSYIPNNALLVRMTAGQAQSLSGVVQAVIPFEPYYKLDLNLLKQTQEGQPAATSLNVLVFPDARAETLDALTQFGVNVVAESPSPFGPELALANVQDVAALARIPGIQRLEARSPRQPANDLSRAIVGVSTDTVTITNYLGLSGQNVLVDVNDSGVDATHPDLAGRMFSQNAANLLDANGHGTHVAGIIAGDGTESLTVSNALGSINPGTNMQYRGKAPNASLFVMNQAAYSDYQLQVAAARTNALISNNSWGYSGSDYDIASASFDAAARDALPETPGSQPVLFVFSAGNSGGGDDDGLNGSPDTVVSPATAKNVITVGAIELPRNITNGAVLDFTTCTSTNIGGTNYMVCITNQPWLGMTDSSNQVARFSSRGNVGIGIEGDYGRFKPDVVAPGTFVVSTRSAQWNKANYYNGYSSNSIAFLNQTVSPDSLLLLPPANVPDNAVQFIVRITSATPALSLPIYVQQNGTPDTNYYYATANDSLSLPPDAALATGQDYFIGVANPSSSSPVNFDLQVTVVLTNSQGNVFEVLSNLNESIGSPAYYRYETGTSLAAADVSGTLALMQEFFQARNLRNSPALMKALLINGARPVSGAYDFQVQNAINYEGWGLINLPDSLPGGLSDAATIVDPPVNTPLPMLMFDQSPQSALATGDSRTFRIQVDSAATSSPMRYTLVWTDPPGNPAAGLKLVNDLDLIVTNLDTGGVYFGNDIQAGENFNVAWDTNGLPNRDVVNNVENIYIAPTLGTNYSVTVRARAVNVNAVTAQTNAIVQDFALVISSADGEVTNALQLISDAGVFSPNYTNLTVMTNQFGNVNSNIFGQVLGNQQVGANSPLLGTNGVPSTTADGVITLGETNQWHFYVITNTTSFTNAVFATSLPLNLAPSRMGVTNVTLPDQATRPQADIDLYETTDPLLLTLDSNAVANANQSLSRGGFETIVLSNAVQNQIYYIGVKSEDHQAAQYTLTVLFSLYPFNNGDNTFAGFPTPAFIPDGSPALPGAVAVTAYAVGQPNALVRRVVVTNVVTHENFGDLIGTLTHNGNKPAVLNNHTYGNGNLTQQTIYEDTGGGDIPGSKHSDGPGSLGSFVGDQIGGQWSLVMVDNSLTHTGRVEDLTVHIDPHLQNNLPSGSTNGVVLQNCVTVADGGLEYDFVSVPFDGTAVDICLSNAVPMQLYIRNGALPTPATYDYATTIPAGGGCFTVSLADLPPLQPGTLFFAIGNTNGASADVCYQASLTISLAAVVPLDFTFTGPTPLLDDAVTYSSITVAPNLPIASASVGVVLTDPRVSDLALTLISPTGERYLLFENRGGSTVTNLGHLNVTTNFFSTAVPCTSGCDVAQTNVIGPVPTAGILVIDYDMYNLPDSMDVFYDGVDIFSTGGLISGAGTFTIPYGPGVGKTITIVMNLNGNTNNTTQWIYTPTVVNEEFSYLTFTEDPTLAQTPIKFAVPPLDSNAQSLSFDISGFEGTTNGVYVAPNTNLADAFGNWKMDTNSVVVGTNLLSMANNQVSVVTDPGTAQSGSNYLALGYGTIARNVATIPGQRYTLSYWYRGPGIAGWYRGEGNANDSSDPETMGNNGTLIGRFNFPQGEVNQAFQFDGTNGFISLVQDPDQSYVQVRETHPAGSAPLDVGAGSGFTVEGWIYPTNRSVRAPLVEWLAPVLTNGVDTNLSIVAGPILNNGNGHYYYLLADTNWAQSEVWAEQLGGHLATIQDANEQNWVYDTFAEYGGTNRTLWIGLNNADFLGTFNWASGETNVFYTNWLTGQPFNCGGDDHYVALLNPTNAQPGLWALADNDGFMFCPRTANRIHGVVEVDDIPTNGVQFWVSMTNSFGAAAGCLYADIVDVLNNSHVLFSAPDLIQANVFQHVALTYDTNSGFANLYYNGTNVASTNLGVFRPLTGGDLLLGKDMSRLTNNTYYGRMDEMSVYRRFLSPTEIAMIYAISAATNTAATNGILGKFDATVTPAFGLAEAQVSIGGDTNVIYGDNDRWQFRSLTFTATTNFVPLQITGLQPGILLDTVSLVQATPASVYYLPEVSLAGLVGQSAQGRWTLEVQDLRAGATDFPAQILSWQMQFIFQNTLPLATPLNPFIASTNIVPPGKTAYFTVNVPSWAFAATNILLSASSPVNLLYNPTNPPTGAGPGDLTLLAASLGGVGVPDLVATGSPALVPGQTYYLGVQNNGANPATVALEVDFNLTTLSNGVPLYGRFNTNDTARYFAFDVATNDLEATFQLLGLSGNADLVVSHTLPLPTLTSSDYGGFNKGAADETIYVLTNSSPVALSSGRWYLGVFKRDTGTVGYNILAKTLSAAGPAITVIDLADNVPFSYTAGAGAALTNFFRFTVTNSAARMHFELFNQTGNGDLIVQTNRLPLASPFLFTGQLPGISPELITVQTNSALTNLNSDWYLGVQNRETNLIRFSILAVVDTNAVFPAFPGADGAGARSVGGRGGDVYHVVNLNDSGPGSLRDAINSATNSRTVVFDITGDIALASPLVITNSYLTIAGQTAPGGAGITVTGDQTTVANAHDLIIRCLRFRRGTTALQFQRVFYVPPSDSLQLVNTYDVILDHVSAEWTTDNQVSVLNSTNVTVQWSILSDALDQTNNPPPTGSWLRYGSGILSLHHNLYADNYSGSPRLGDNLSLDFVNNVIYNWVTNAGYSADNSIDNPLGYTNSINYVGNYAIAGPDTLTTNIVFWGGTTNTWIYQTNSFLDANVNGVLDGADGSWLMFTNWGTAVNQFTETNRAFALPPVPTDEAFLAYEKVLDFAGLNLALRDSVDADIVTKVRTQSGGVIASPVSASLVAWWKGEGNANDSVGNDNGIPQNIAYAPGEVGRAFVFNGTSSEIRVPANPHLDVGSGAGFTLETWIKPGSANFQELMEWNQNSGSGAGPIGVHLEINEAPGDGTLWGNVVDTTGVSHNINSAAGVILPNRFQHVALTYNKADGRAVLYNGVVVAVANLGTFTPQTGFDFFLGNRPAGFFAGNYFDGLMDEPSIYYRALSAFEVASIYASGSAGKFASPPPSLPYLDTDGDGLPDFWETTLGLDPANSLDAAQPNLATLYTHLEDYLNWLAVPHALTVTTNPVAVDLRLISGNTGNQTFFVTNAIFGSVYLTNNLYTNGVFVLSNSIAFFNPSVGASNNASFDYYVTNLETTASVGPIKVSVFDSAVPILYPANTNPPPMLATNLPNVAVDEETLLTVTNTATDVNTNLVLSYTVMLTVDTAAMTANGWPLTYVTTIPSPVIDNKGVITWTPGEAQGPGVYTLTTVVSDNGVPPLMATNSFSVTVNEINSAPYWPTNVPSQTNYYTSALVPLTVINTAQDSDLPPNPLTYELTVSPPVIGAAISANGIITWTPPFGQAPGDYTFTTIVTDTNQYAVNARSLSATNEFTVTVTVVAAPYVFTQPAHPVTGLSAQLNGMVTPNGLATTAWYEWGTDSSYGNVTPAAPVGLGFNVVYVPRVISGLTPNVPYHFRLVAANALGTTYGFDQVLDEAYVAAWGADYVRQIDVPIGLSNVVAIAGAYDHSLALKDNGFAVGWGDDLFGQATVPPGLSNLVAVAGGQYYSMALKNNGTVTSWGANILSQTNVPPGLNNVVLIAGGQFSSMALRNTGTVAAWGANFFGLTAVPPGLRNVVSVASGSYHNLAIRNDGTVVAWGDNSAGQLNIPGGLTNVVAIAGGSYHSLALRSDGTVVGWGDNSAGQINVPPGLNHVVGIAAGGFHSLALLSDGNVVAWGDNSSGQASVPVGLDGVVAVSSGYFQSLALTPINFKSNAPVILDITDGVPQTNNILPGGITYYRVSVPTNVDFTTNTLLFTLNGPLNVWFTSNTPPSITNLNDTLLMPGATNGVAILTTNAASANFVPGQVYYLGVQNTNVSAVTYGIEVDFHFVTVVSTVIIPDFSITYTNIGGTNGFLLTWFAPSNYLFQVQWAATVPTSNWHTFTNIISYDTNVFTSPTNTQFDFFDDGAQSGGLGATRYYQLILLSAAASAPPVLTNGVPVTNSIAAGGVTFYQVVVPTNADYATNLLLFATNSPLNVWFTTNAPPSVGAANDALLLAGANNGASVMGLGTIPPLVPGSVYVLGVENTNPVSVTYALAVDLHLLPPTIPINSVTYTNIGGTNGFLITWFAPTNEVFQVQWAATIPTTSWQSFSNLIRYTGPVTATNGLFAFFDDGSQFPFGGSRSYRVVLMAGNTAPVLPPGGQVYFLNPQAALSVTNTATDSDLPPNILTYALSSSVADTNHLPAIDTNTGIITWTPVLSQAGTSNLLVTVVTDNGIPPLSATNSFVIKVNPVPVISQVGVTTNGFFQLDWFAATNDYFLVVTATNLNEPISWTTNGAYVYPFASNYFRFIDSNTFGGLKFFRLLMFP